MKLLLDTRALLWWLAGDRRIGPKTRDIIEDPANDVLVSVVSLWEIVVKVRAGKLRADIREIAGAIRREGMTQLEITTQYLLRLAELPNHHRDPFDHLLIAQAIAENATFVSAGQHAALYSVPLAPCPD